MNVKNYLPCLALLLLTLILGSVRAKMRVFMSKIECLNYAPQLLLNVSCYVNQTTQRTGSVSVQFSLTKDVTEFKAHYLVSIKRGSSLIEYLSTKIEFCKTLERLHSIYILNIFYTEIRRVSNLPTECPFKMNKLYYVRDFRVDTNLLPSYLPEMDYISSVQLNDKNRKLLKITVHGSLFRA